MNNRDPFPSALNRLGQLGLVIGIIGLVILAPMALGTAGRYQEFMQSYIFGYMFWICFTLGCFGLTLLQHMTRSHWGNAVLRLFEAGNKTLPLMALLFLPIAVDLWHGDTSLYPWARPSMVATDAVVKHKTLFMNAGGIVGGGFLIRYVLYFVIWWGIAAIVNGWARQRDRTTDVVVRRNLAQKLSNLSAPGFVVFILTLTLAFTDWVMSLDAHWYSTIWGLWFFMACGLSGVSLIAAIVTILHGTKPFTDEVIDIKVRRDLGNMLIMLVMVWGYFSLSQFLIIWSGNLPEEISYYLTRNAGGLLVVGAINIIFQFFVPFLLLLSGRNKTSVAPLARIAVFLLVMRVVNLYWVVVPTYRPVGEIHWQDFAALFGIGGLWLFCFIWNAKRYPLVPAMLTAHDETGAQEVVHEHA